MRRFLRLVRQHLTYANSMATVAVLIAAAGSAQAAGIGSFGIADNSIQSRDIRNGTIGSVDLASGSVNLVDLAAAARASLQGAGGRDGTNGADGRDGTNGVDGRDGAPGPAGDRGPIGPRGPAGEDGSDGSTFDDVMDLETLACTANGRIGTLDVVLAAPNGDYSAVTLRCAFPPPAPLTCSGNQPANATTSCNTGTGQWEIQSCNANYHDINGNQADGCEYFNVTTGPETCDGLDNDSDGVVDDAPTDQPAPASNSTWSCGGAGGWQLDCQPGWYDTDATLANGCESNTP